MIQEDKKTVTEKVQKEATEVVQKGTEEVQKGTEEVQETAKASSEEAASFLGDWLRPLEPYPLLYAVVVTVGLLILLWFTHLIIRFLVIKPLIGNRLMDRVKWIHVDDLGKSKVLSSVSSILSMGIIGMVVDVLPRFEPNYLLNAHRVVDALFVFFVAQLIVRTANLLDMMYSRLPSVNRPGRCVDTCPWEASWSMGERWSSWSRRSWPSPRSTFSPVSGRSPRSCSSCFETRCSRCSRTSSSRPETWPAWATGSMCPPAMRTAT